MGWMCSRTGKTSCYRWNQLLNHRDQETSAGVTVHRAGVTSPVLDDKMSFSMLELRRTDNTTIGPRKWGAANSHNRTSSQTAGLSSGGAAMGLVPEVGLKSSDLGMMRT